MSEEGSEERSPLLGSMIVDSPVDQRQLIGERPKGTTWFTASLIMLNATLGAGLLNFPAAFDAGGGIATSMIMQTVLALIAGFSFVLISWMSDMRGCTTYQDTMGSICGNFVKNLCSILMILYTYGSCVAYLIVVGDESDRIFYVRYGPEFCYHWYMDRKFIITVASIVLILPFCYAKKIDFLKYASGLATLGVLYFIILTVYVYIEEAPSDIDIKTKPDHWSDVFKIVPTLCFAYQSHLSVVPTYACMEKRNLRFLTLAVSLATILSFVAYSLVGIFGYLTFGRYVQPDILSSFAIDNVAVAIGFFVFAIKVFLTYPVMEYVGREALESFWTQAFKLDRVQVILGEKNRRYWFATVWFATSLLIGIFVPNIIAVIGLLGSFAALFIFVFPGLCLLKSIILLQDSMDNVWLKRLAYFIAFFCIFVGVFVFGLTLVQVAEDFFVSTKLSHHYHRAPHFLLAFRDRNLQC